MQEYTTSRYQVLGKIGEGVHGIVLKAIDLTNNQVVAIKKVSLKNKYGEISLNTLREIKVLQNCDCENILSLKDLFPDLIGLSLVFEYMPHTLYSKLHDESNPLCRQEVNDITKMLLKGLKYLHSLDIMHRDIKPANLLISEKGLLKIADFGLARLYHPDDEERCYSPQVASRWYRAPETLWGTSKYGPAIDMWAVGCVFAEMLRGVPLFAGNTDIEQLALVIRTLGTPNHEEWPELQTLPDYNKIRFPESKGVHWENIFPASTTKDELDLVNSLVKYNPRYRLTAAESLSHQYLTIGNEK